MTRTKIEWVNNNDNTVGEVWNPVTGCTKVSQGCKYCYAERVSERFWKDRKFTDIQMHENRLEQPLKWKKPRMVFVNSMSDLFHESVPFEFIAKVFEIMEKSKNHTFQILTKRPKRMKEFEYDCLPNVWLGVSVEDQATANERIPTLLEIPASVRFVSYEPALGPVDFTQLKQAQHLHWVICGGESGPNARPMHPDWARSVRDQCQQARIPFFMKQICKNGRTIPYNDLPTDLRIREYPNSIHNLEKERDKKGRFKKAAGRELDGQLWNEFPV